jgi:hypothetical protein
MAKVEGTNCYNCMYVSRDNEKVSKDELNDEGGIDPRNDREMRKAKAADLITLPGGTKKDARNKRFCTHPMVTMGVTVRMCCAYWDNKAVKRPWKK